MDVHPVLKKCLFINQSRGVKLNIWVCPKVFYTALHSQADNVTALPFWYAMGRVIPASLEAPDACLLTPDSCLIVTSIARSSSETARLAEERFLLKYSRSTLAPWGVPDS
jgi:hypothetical protein